jgi:uncharacterized membrane protein YdfJ with MMPL/SSD domain
LAGTSAGKSNARLVRTKIRSVRSTRSRTPRAGSSQSPRRTAAALLLIVVVAGFATGDVAFSKLIGIGMITAIVVEATLVRALLAPAVMGLLGRPPS